MRKKTKNRFGLRFLIPLMGVVLLHLNSFLTGIPVQSPLKETGKIELENITPIDDNKGGRRDIPLAKSLLTKPPPFQDSEIIKLSNNTLVASLNTVVTAYFRVSSKYKHRKYNAWMSNMLSLQDAMVIYTQRDLVSHIQQL
jgi:hypothetical protein